MSTLIIRSSCLLARYEGFEQTTFGLHEFLGGSDFYYSSRIHHNNAIEIQDGVQSMSNCNDGAICERSTQYALHKRVGLYINTNDYR
jgi:hypothetical protein